MPAKDIHQLVTEGGGRAIITRSGPTSTARPSNPFRHEQSVTGPALPCIYLGDETGVTLQQGCGASAMLLHEHKCECSTRPEGATCYPDWKSGCTSKLGRAIPCRQCTLYEAAKVE